MTLTRKQMDDLIDFQNGAGAAGDRETVQLIDRALEDKDPEAIKLALKLLAEAQEREREEGWK